MPDSASGLAIASTTRPTFVHEGTQRDDLSESLLMLEVSEDWLSGRTAEAAFSNWGPTGRSGRPGYSLFENPVKLGDSLQVRLGEESLISGFVSGVEGRYSNGEPPRFAITVSEDLARLDQQPGYKVFEELKLSEIVESVCGDYGIEVAFFVNQDPLVRLANQAGQSAYRFLRELMVQADLYWYFDDGNLMVKERHVSAAEPLTLNAGSNLLSCDTRANVLGVPSELRAKQFDEASGETREAHVDVSDLSPGVEAVGAGPTVSQAVFGGVVGEFVGGPLGASSLELAARSAIRQASRAFLLGDGECAFDTRMRVGAEVEFSGLGPPFDGRAFIASVTHVFTGESGMKTCFISERDGLKGLVPNKKAKPPPRERPKPRVPIRRGRLITNRVDPSSKTRSRRKS